MYGSTSGVSKSYLAESGTTESGKFIVYRVASEPRIVAKPGTIAVKAPIEITGFCLMYKSKITVSGSSLGGIIYAIDDTADIEETLLIACGNPYYSARLPGGQMYQRTHMYYEVSRDLEAVDAWVYASSGLLLDSYHWMSTNY